MANKWCYQFHRIPDLSVALLVVQLLGEVDEGGEGEDGHGHEDEQQPELLVGLLQRVEEGLQAGEMANQLENPQDSHHSHLRKSMQVIQVEIQIQIKA